MAGLFKLFNIETEGAKNDTSTADECTDETDMTIRVVGKNKFAATLQKTALSEFHELIKHAVSPILAELEGPMSAKLRPITETEAEPDKANAD